MAGLSERLARADHWVDPPDAQLLELRDAIAGRQSLTGPGESLTQQERLALHAFYLQSRDVEEARGVLGLSRSGFYRVLSSACQRLRRMLEGGVRSRCTLHQQQRPRVKRGAAMNCPNAHTTGTSWRWRFRWRSKRLIRCWLT